MGILGAVGLGASVLGTGLQLFGQRKRERATNRAQGNLERAAQAYYQERGERSDALADVFSNLAAQRGQTTQQFLDSRLAEDRAMSGAEREDRLAQAVQAAQFAVPEAYGLDGLDASMAAQARQYQPTLDAVSEVGMADAMMRGLSDYDLQQARLRDLEYAGQQRHGTQAGIVSGVGSAELDTAYGQQQRLLNQRLADAGQAGGNLSLAGAILQQGGLLTSSIGAMQRPPTPPPPQDTVKGGLGMTDLFRPGPNPNQMLS